MRVLIVGDQHFRYELPYGAAFKDGRRSEWSSVIETIVEASKTCDAVVLLGDNLNSRHNHSSVLREFLGFIKAFGLKEVHIIAGNHERYGQETALDFLQSIRIDERGWWVYTEPGFSYFGDGTDFVFLPYMTPNLVKKGSVQEAKEEVMQRLVRMKHDGRKRALFMHHGIRGSIWGDGTVDASMFNEITFTQAELEEHFDFVFGGHVHHKQKLSDKVYVAGSIFTSEVGETEKSVFILDTESMKVEEVPLPVRGIHRVKVDTGNMYTSFARIPENSIVKIIVVDREVSMDYIHRVAEKYDGSVVIEQYPNERTKTHFKGGALDLSLPNLLKVYSEEKGLSYSDLQEGLSLVDAYDLSRSRPIPNENGHSNTQ